MNAAGGGEHDEIVWVDRGASPDARAWWIPTLVAVGAMLVPATWSGIRWLLGGPSEVSQLTQLGVSFAVAAASAVYGLRQYRGARPLGPPETLRVVRSGDLVVCTAECEGDVTLRFSGPVQDVLGIGRDDERGYSSFSFATSDGAWHDLGTVAGFHQAEDVQRALQAMCGVPRGYFAHGRWTVIPPET